jgi:hypothetical protein
MTAPLDPVQNMKINNDNLQRACMDGTVHCCKALTKYLACGD